MHRKRSASSANSAFTADNLKDDGLKMVFEVRMHLELQRERKENYTLNRRMQRKRSASPAKSVFTADNLSDDVLTMMLEVRVRACTMTH
jgi:hypothetical protein